MKLLLNEDQVMTPIEQFCFRKYLNPLHIALSVEKLRAEGKTIATLNGSFDLLHAGHLHMIYEASLQADILIVALNSDASIRGYKNPQRPIITLEYRLQMMAALGFVDYVTWFDELDPRAILSLIMPNVHINGPEWGSECIEAATVRRHGGRIHIVDLVPGLSTTAIIGKIKSIV